MAYRRGRLSLRCLPFERQLLVVLLERSVAVGELVGTAAVASGYTRRALSWGETDWLIAVGVLRREVDGQGLTDRFRLTPLGRQLLSEWQTTAWPPPSWGERLRHRCWRWLRR
ncbi:MAG: hypothetical protein Q6K81_04340 [Gloeomargarita sp. DG02_5_bins_242]